MGGAGGGGETNRQPETDRQTETETKRQREERSKESHGERFGQPKTFIFFNFASPELTVREGSKHPTTSHRQKENTSSQEPYDVTWAGKGLRTT